jgi:osmotically-inducible protein OsmY
MTTHEAGSDSRRPGLVIGESELAERIEGHIERRASGRIRDLHVVCSDGMIILMGRSRTYHAKQLAQEAVFDLTEGQASLANEIVVS